MITNVLLAVWLLAGHAVSAQPARPPEGGGRTLIVGTKDAAPFAFTRPDGTWAGISIDLWRGIAAELGYRFELRETDLQGLVDGVRDGSLDLAVAALTVTPDREAALDFTHPFHVSGLGIVVRATDGANWLAVVRQFFSTAFLRIVLALGGLVLLVAILVWVLERRANPEQFGGSPVRGIGASFWWSAVTMTTVGYGDKAPRTAGGRAIALVWMFAGLIVISSFTASITTSLTVGALEGRVQGPNDLENVRLGSLPDSTSAAYLESRALPFTSYGLLDDALMALARGDVDAVVYDEPMLRYAVRQSFGGTLRVLPVVFDRQFYGIGLRTGSPLREPVNETLLREISAPRWADLLERYLGSGN